MKFACIILLIFSQPFTTVATLSLCTIQKEAGAGFSTWTIDFPALMVTGKLDDVCVIPKSNSFSVKAKIQPAS